MGERQHFLATGDDAVICLHAQNGTNIKMSAVIIILAREWFIWQLVWRILIYLLVYLFIYFSPQSLGWQLSNV